MPSLAAAPQEMSETSGRPLTSAAAQYEAVGPLAESRWRQAFPWLTETGRSRELLRLLRTSENAYRSSATQLRAKRPGLADRGRRPVLGGRFLEDVDHLLDRPALGFRQPPGHE